MINTRKSQTEIMGLAIIIILIALAMLFVIQFVVLKEPDDTKKSFTHKEIASNTVGTMLTTTTECKQLSIGQLLKDCAEGPFITCPTGDSCSYTEAILEDILQQTIETWNKDYYFNVTRTNIEFGNVPDKTNPQPCPGEKITSSPCCILPTGQGPMTITLDICG